MTATNAKRRADAKNPAPGAVAGSSPAAFRNRGRWQRRARELVFATRRAVAQSWGKLIAATGVVLLASGQIVDLRFGPLSLVGSAGLFALVVTLVIRLGERLRGAMLNATAGDEASSDVEIASLLLVTLYAGLLLSGGVRSPGYPLLYLVIAFATTFFTRAVGLAVLLVAVAIEVLLGRRFHWPVAATVIHAALLALFATAHWLFLQIEAVARKFEHKNRVESAIRNMRQEARDFRLISAPLQADPKVRSREMDEERLAIGAVETIHQALFYTLELLKKSLDLHTCVLLWLDESGERLKIKEIVSESDCITETSVAADSGAVGTVVKNRLLVNLSDPKHSHLPYYAGPEEIGAFVGVPVVEDGHLRGVLAADRRTDRPFGIKDEQLLSEAAEQLLRSIKSERVFAAVERSKYEHERFFGALATLNRALTPDEVCQRTFEATREIASFDFAALTTYDQALGTHAIIAVAGEAPKGLEAGVSFQDNQSLVSMVVKNKHYLPAGGELRDRDTVIFRKSIKVPGFESLIVLPLIVADHAIGTYVIGTRRQRMFGKEKREMLSVIANHVAVSLSNAQMYGRMEKMATTDGLTGLYNHRTFQERLLEMLARAERNKQPLAVLLTDVDHFKKVNDTYGHPVGDQVLRGVAQVVQRSVRKVDLAARYGGEEFAIVLEGTDRAGAMLLAERIRTEVQKQVFPSAQGNFGITLSLGVALFADDATQAKELIAAADQALYFAKRNGRNRAVSFIELAAKTQLKVV